jgi:hypothetical protein
MLRGTYFSFVLASVELSPVSSHRYAASVVLAVAYGRHNVSFDDPAVQAVFRCVRRFGNNLAPGLWKVDTYPFMKSVIPS